MIDIMQQLANDPSVDSQFRRILAGHRATVSMKSTHKDSRILLEQIAESICSTDSQRSMLQTAYDLGVLDGSIDQNRKAAEMVKELAK